MLKGGIMDRSEEDKLEEVLRLAADGPAHRPQFYKAFLESQIFVLGTTEQEGSDGKLDLDAG